MNLKLQVFVAVAAMLTLLSVPTAMAQETPPEAPAVMEGGDVNYVNAMSAFDVCVNRMLSVYPAEQRAGMTASVGGLCLNSRQSAQSSNGGLSFQQQMALAKARQPKTDWAALAMQGLGMVAGYNNTQAQLKYGYKNNQLQHQTYQAFADNAGVKMGNYGMIQMDSPGSTFATQNSMNSPVIDDGSVVLSQPQAGTP